jgi:hypothetical protein
MRRPAWAWSRREALGLLILQKQGTKTPNHTISFQGNHTSLELALHPALGHLHRCDWRYIEHWAYRHLHRPTGHGRWLFDSHELAQR